MTSKVNKFFAFFFCIFTYLTKFEGRHIIPLGKRLPNLKKNQEVRNETQNDMLPAVYVLALSVLAGCGASTGRGEAVSGAQTAESGAQAEASGKTTLRGNAMSMIFQDPMTSLNPIETVGSQIEEVILNHNRVSRARAREMAEEKLDMVGIPRERFDEYPHQFSGGMKQRIAIALACNPDLLIADEPTKALNVTIQAQILNRMMDLQEKLGLTYIFVTHDLSVVKHISNKIAVMYLGNLVEYAETEELFANPSHPYTQALLASVPTIDLKKGKADSGDHRGDLLPHQPQARLPLRAPLSPRHGAVLPCPTGAPRNQRRSQRCLPFA